MCSNRKALVLAGLILASPCLADSRSWKKLASNGQVANAILAASARPATLFASTDSGVFRSDSAGDLWIDVSGGFPPAPADETVRYLVLAIDPSAAEIAYAIRFAQTLDFQQRPSVLFRTADGGGRWIPIFTGDLRSLVIDPRNSAVLYAATAAGVLRSSDGGIRWAVLRAGDATAVATDGSAPANLFAAVSGQGVLKSTDSGQTWSRTGFPGEYVDRLIVAADRPSTIYAIVTQSYGRPFSSFPTSSISRSDDSGTTWTVVAPFLTSQVSIDLVSLVVDPKSWSVLYAVSDGALRRSVDGGVDWRLVPFELPATRLTAVSVSPDGSILYAAAGVEGVFELPLGGRPIGRSDPPRNVPFR